MRAISAAITGTFTLLLSYYRSGGNADDYQRTDGYQNYFKYAHICISFYIRYAFFLNIPLFLITITVTTAAATTAQMNAVHHQVPMV